MNSTDKIKEIEKKTFDYYVTSGSTPDFPEQKLDTTILLDNFLCGFTIFENSKQYSLYPIKIPFKNFIEEISGDFITHRYFYGEAPNFVLAGKVTDSAKLRNFSRKVQNALWGI